MLETRAFEADFLARLDALVLGARRARTVRAGRRAVGRVQGTGIEPESFREYSEGDDLRFLDWNVYARLDDLTLRTFRSDRQVEVTVLIDASASMGCPAVDDKLGLALALGAALAYVALGVNDPVRLAAFSVRRGALQIESSGFYHRRESYVGLRPFVARLGSGGQASLGAAVGDLLAERRPAGIVIVLSDFLFARQDYEEALTQLTAARHEVRAVHVMGQCESMAAYPPGFYRMRDCESGRTMEVAFGPAAADACRRRVAQHSDQLRMFCQRRGIIYASAFGANNLDQIVARELPRLGVLH